MNSWEFLHRWWMPFLWITLSSLIATPVAIYFQLGMDLHAGDELGLPYGDAWVLRDDFLATIVVYGLHLGAVIWLFNADGSTRWAAFWATLIGFAHLAAPIALASMVDVPVGVNRHYIDWNTMRAMVWFQDAQLFLLGLMAWSLFARFVGAEQTGFRQAFAEA